MERIELRRTRSEDATELAALELAYTRETRHEVGRAAASGERKGSRLSGNELGYLIVLGDATAGYLFVRKDADPPVIERFFVKPAYRRRGVGAVAFELLKKELGASVFDIEVMIWNDVGRAFLERIGFRPRSLGLRHTVVK